MPDFISYIKKEHSPKDKPVQGPESSCEQDQELRTASLPKVKRIMRKKDIGELLQDPVHFRRFELLAKEARPWTAYAINIHLSSEISGHDASHTLSLFVELGLASKNEADQTYSITPKGLAVYDRWISDRDYFFRERNKKR